MSLRDELVTELDYVVNDAPYNYEGGEGVKVFLSHDHVERMRKLVQQGKSEQAKERASA